MQHASASNQLCATLASTNSSTNCQKVWTRLSAKVRAGFRAARGLSGGQAHRVALARVLLDENARVLVFDEPTAHLDIETELELKERMLPLMEGKLVVFATHRLHWVKDMDRVIELDDRSER